VPFEAELSNAQQLINCSVACEGIAGTLRTATLKPTIPPYLFRKDEHGDVNKRQQRLPLDLITGLERPRGPSEEQFENEFEDADLVAAAYVDEDGYEDVDEVMGSQASLAGTGKPRKPAIKQDSDQGGSRNRTNDNEPKRLPNGNWACNHGCKDKQACKHACCKVGSENKPKKKKAKQSQDDVDTPKASKSIKTKANSAAKKRTALVHADPFSAAKKPKHPDTAITTLPLHSGISKRPRSARSEFDGDDIFDEPTAIPFLAQQDPFSGLSAFKPVNARLPSGNNSGLLAPKHDLLAELDLSSDVPDYGDRGGINESIFYPHKPLGRLHHGISPPKKKVKTDPASRNRAGSIQQACTSQSRNTIEDQPEVTMSKKDASCYVTPFSQQILPLKPSQEQVGQDKSLEIIRSAFTAPGIMYRSSIESGVDVNARNDDSDELPDVDTLLALKVAMQDINADLSDADATMDHDANSIIGDSYHIDEYEACDADETIYDIMNEGLTETTIEDEGYHTMQHITMHALSKDLMGDEIEREAELVPEESPKEKAAKVKRERELNDPEFNAWFDDLAGNIAVFDASH
jgi:hypothetical protein